MNISGTNLIVAVQEYLQTQTERFPLFLTFIFLALNVNAGILLLVKVEVALFLYF